MGWIGCVRCKKSKRDNVERTFALITAVHYVLQQVSCSYGTIPNAPKYYEIDRNISLWSNGVDGVRWLRKITTRFVARTFALIGPVQYVLQQVSCGYGTNPKCTQILQNGTKH